MKMNAHIRLIRMTDASGTLEVYAPYIRNTVITFEYDVPSSEEWNQRIQTVTEEYPWLVCEVNGVIAGYAYACKHKTRTAYNWSVDSAVYVSESFHGSGVARLLYQTLFAILKFQGYVNVYAGVTLPNIKSEKFHRSFGFTEVGVYKNVGYKFGAWRDVRWYEKSLREHGPEPETPKHLPSILTDTELNKILTDANTQLLSSLTT